jgi:hypothetical protein
MEFIRDLVAKGWIRIRLYPARRWSINVAALNEQVRGSLSAWVTHFLEDATVTGKVGPQVPVRITALRGRAVNTTLQSLANTGNGGEENCEREELTPEQRALRNAFTHWLKGNRHRFPVQPSVTIKPETGFIITFPGMAPEIEVLAMGRTGGYAEIVVSVDYRDECWDLVEDFEVVVRRHSSHIHSCDWCLPEAKQIFRSRLDLLANHLFGPLLRWAEKNLTTSRWACLFGSGSTWVEMVNEEDMERKRGEEQFIDAFPVLRR